MASMYYKFTSEFTINRFISEGGKDGEHGRMENKAEFHDERKLIFILACILFMFFLLIYNLNKWLTDSFLFCTNELCEVKERMKQSRFM
jgi:hypothetical protein